eukprot:ANDGO_00594.mRNA.1 hypothetical protein
MAAAIDGGNSNNDGGGSNGGDAGVLPRPPVVSRQQRPKRTRPPVSREPSTTAVPLVEKKKSSSRDESSMEEEETPVSTPASTLPILAPTLSSPRPVPTSVPTATAKPTPGEVATAVDGEEQEGEGAGAGRLQRMLAPVVLLHFGILMVFPVLAFGTGPEFSQPSTSTSTSPYTSMVVYVGSALLTVLLAFVAFASRSRRTCIVDIVATAAVLSFHIVIVSMLMANDPDLSSSASDAEFELPSSSASSRLVLVDGYAALGVVWAEIALLGVHVCLSTAHMLGPRTTPSFKRVAFSQVV